ncbi:MAG: hypothetical protein R3212_12385 [Xanthomonadales bacterium]|nr:hypothetical protein [Xanthomonadales bacterium]
MFWTIAITMLIASGLILGWPLLARGSNWRAPGLGVLLVLPLGGALLYHEVGTPTAMALKPAVSDSADFNALVDDLRSRLSERPEDLEGWLLLGRSLKSLQRFGEARDALETANRIAPNTPQVMVELAEARLFASGQQSLDDASRAMLESAVDMDSSLQKGVWLLGIDAAQRGDDQAAIAYWERLLVLLGPGSEVAPAVQEQVNLARSRLGLASEPVTGEASEWPGIEVAVDLADEASSALPETLPDSAVLFVIARGEGQNAGPPLGVVRIDQPQFPVDLNINDSHAMIPQSRLSGQPALRIVARLSMSGQPGANEGDWQSDPVDVPSNHAEPVQLTLAHAAE